jgi:methyl-accepting chemotaxis protein
LKAITKRIVSIMTLCTFLSVLLVGLLSIHTARRITNEKSVQRLSLLSDTSELRIDTVIDSIQQSVGMLEKYTLNNLDDPDAFRNDPDYVDRYSETMKPILVAAAQKTNGAMSVYLRYNPSFTRVTSGLFIVKNSASGEFESQTPTDFSRYDPSDTEHVGWYYTPVADKHATWMPPYLNKNINTYMISYVIPLYIDGECYGVIGMDIDFSLLRKMVDGIHIYDTGYAFLLDNSQNIMIYPDIEIYTPVSDMENGSWTNLFTAENIGRNDLTFHSRGKTMNAAVRQLGNGMILVLSAPVKEIFRDTYALTNEIILAAIVSILLVMLVSCFVVSRMMRPAVTDALTDIDNRQSFLSKVNERISSGRSGTYAYIMLDIDHFKQVNDTKGHEAGDRALRQIALFLQREFAAEDIIGRFGGDEFLVFMQSVDRAIVEKRLKSFQETIRSGGQVYGDPLQCSIGVVLTDDTKLTAEELLTKVDTALYRAKEGGRDHWEFF